MLYYQNVSVRYVELLTAWRVAEFFSTGYFVACHQ